MEISVLTNNTKCKRVGVDSMDGVAQLMRKETISAGIFKDDYRKIENFERADFILLDVDDGCSLQEAVDKFKKYDSVIAPTRNHRQEKNGVVADRFRVLLKLEQPITNKDDYYETYNALLEEFPFADKQCKDPSRQYFASPGKVVKLKGAPVKVRKWVPKEVKSAPATSGFKGKLAFNTLNFIAFGAKAGEWNYHFNKAAFDIRQNGYSKEEAIHYLTKPTGKLDNEDLRVIDSIYNGELKYEPRGVTPNPFNFMRISDLKKTSSNVEWIVDGLLTKGGFSILAGEPKSGKSTIVRQLTKCVAKGHEFLRREVKKGKILYLALEEQPELLKEQFEKVGIDESCDIEVHVGSIHGEGRYDYLKQHCMDVRPDLVVIDTMALFLQVENLNDYATVNGPLMQLRDIARESGAHVLNIHHTNKSEIVNVRSIMGSGAIHGAVDCAIIFQNFRGVRKVTTSQRGGRPFDSQALTFNADTEEYFINDSVIDRRGREF